MKKIIVPLILLVSIGCIQKEENLQINIDLLSKPIKKISHLSEIATNVEYIPLQTSDNSLISYIHDMKADSNRLYIYILNEILCFDERGLFLFKLDKEGRGPEEYTYIYDWDISPDGNYLLILLNRRIILYNNTGKNFEFLKSFRLIGSPSTADFVPGHNYILLSSFSSAGNDIFRNVIIDFMGDTLNSRLNYYKFYPETLRGFAFTYSNLHYIFNNSIKFKEVTCDTIFTLEENKEIKPYLILDSHGLLPLPQDFTNFSIENIRERLNVQRILEVPRFLIFRILYKDLFFLVYDKNTFQMQEINAETFLEDDLVGGVNFEPKFCMHNKLYSWVDVLTLKKHISGKGFIESKVLYPKQRDSLQKLVDNLQVTENPVLIVVTPKE